MQKNKIRSILGTDLVLSMKKNGAEQELFRFAALAGSAEAGVSVSFCSAGGISFFLKKLNPRWIKPIGHAAAHRRSGCILRMSDRIDVHSADAGAFAAVHALALVYLQAIEADLVEQAVDCSAANAAHQRSVLYHKR